jgi:type VI protein secretion system component VasF
MNIFERSVIQKQNLFLTVVALVFAANAVLLFSVFTLKQSSSSEKLI